MLTILCFFFLAFFLYILVKREQDSFVPMIIRVDEKMDRKPLSPAERDIMARILNLDRFFEKPLEAKPKSLAEIERFLMGCQYISDLEHKGISDYWEPPEEFEKDRKGDCEDHSLWAWRQLLEMGYRVRFVAGEYCGNKHAWICLLIKGRWHILETVYKSGPFPQAGDYVFKVSIRRERDGSFTFFKHD